VNIIHKISLNVEKLFLFGSILTGNSWSNALNRIIVEKVSLEHREVDVVIYCNVVAKPQDLLLKKGHLKGKWLLVHLHQSSAREKAHQ